MNRLKCCICHRPIEEKVHNGKVYWRDGNNAEPVKHGRCCDACNATVVLNARLKGVAYEQELAK